VFTTVRHWSLSYARRTKSTPSHHTALRSTLILSLSSIYAQVFRVVSSLQVSVPKFCMHLSFPPSVLHDSLRHFRHSGNMKGAARYVGDIQTVHQTTERISIKFDLGDSQVVGWNLNFDSGTLLSKVCTVGCEVFRATKIQVAVFWVVTSCSDVVGYQRFGASCSFHLQCTMSQSRRVRLRFVS
jgi:hypothetical protein